MRVLALVPYPTAGPSNRLRVEQYLPWLAQQGISAEMRPFFSSAAYQRLYEPGARRRKIAQTTAGLLRRCTDLVRAARADVVVVQREALPLGTALVERLIARLGRPLIFDFDDAIYLDNGSAANRWSRRFKRAEKTAEIIRCSAHVIAGNQTLAEYARRFHPGVTVIPTPVDTDRVAPRPTSTAHDEVVIGWMGSPTTGEYLRLVQEPLVRLMLRYPHARVRIVGAPQPPLTLPRVEGVAWRLDREVDELRSFDIGIMPMPDNEWTRGKCGFKALLYMSAGLPVVASPVGVNADIVRDGVTGFTAADAEAWTNRLAQLIEDRPLRRRMGLAGRALVEERYALRRQAPRFIDVLHRAFTGETTPHIAPRTEETITACAS